MDGSRTGPGSHKQLNIDVDAIRHTFLNSALSQTVQARCWAGCVH